MQAGDLVRFRSEDTDWRGRKIGLLIRFDISMTTKISLIIWNNGSGWVRSERIEAIPSSDLQHAK